MYIKTASVLQNLFIVLHCQKQAAAEVLIYDVFDIEVLLKYLISEYCFCVLDCRSAAPSLHPSLPLTSVKFLMPLWNMSVICSGETIMPINLISDQRKIDVVVTFDMMLYINIQIWWRLYELHVEFCLLCSFYRKSYMLSLIHYNKKLYSSITPTAC